jgi:hypothetical protein
MEVIEKFKKPTLATNPIYYRFNVMADDSTASGAVNAVRGQRITNIVILYYESHDSKITWLLKSRVNT